MTTHPPTAHRPTTHRPRDPDFAARVRDSFGRQPFMATIGAELVRVEPGELEIWLPGRGDLTQQHGFIHGGVIGTLADTAGAYAAYSLFPADSTLLTVEFKLNLLAPARGQGLRALGRVVKAGRTLSVSHTEVIAVAEEGETVCATALVTLMALHGQADAPPVSPG